MTMNLDFPGKVTHCSYDQGSDEEDDTIMSKVAKGKGKTRGKNGKIGKCAEERDNESTDSSNPNYDLRRLMGSWRLSIFLYKGLHKEKETSLLSLCMANFGLTATSLFKIWTHLG